MSWISLDLEQLPFLCTTPIETRTQTEKNTKVPIKSESSEHNKSAHEIIFGFIMRLETQAAWVSRHDCCHSAS